MILSLRLFQILLVQVNKGYATPTVSMYIDNNDITSLTLNYEMRNVKSFSFAMESKTSFGFVYVSTGPCIYKAGRLSNFQHHLVDMLRT